MAKSREIVTKAVVGKGKKTFVTTDVITPEIMPTTILGAWIINHNFSGRKNGDKVEITGSYDVNIWYSCMNDSKTEVVKKSVQYDENVTVPKKNDASLSDEEVVIRSLKQPTCTRAEIIDGKIEFTVEKQLGIELVGDTKVKISYEEDEDPWEDIEDDQTEAQLEQAEQQIDNEIQEEFLDE